jgi:hypothetical protein
MSSRLPSKPCILELDRKHTDPHCGSINLDISELTVVWRFPQDLHRQGLILQMLAMLVDRLGKIALRCNGESNTLIITEVEISADPLDVTDHFSHQTFAVEFRGHLGREYNHDASRFRGTPAILLSHPDIEICSLQLDLTICIEA